MVLNEELVKVWFVERRLVVADYCELGVSRRKVEGTTTSVGWEKERQKALKKGGTLDGRRKA